MRGAGERLGEFPVEFPRVTKSTMGTSPNSAKFDTSRIAHCTVPPTFALQQRHMSLFLFFLRLLLIFFCSQVPRTPLSLANHEGGCLLFFSRRRALSAHKRVARRCRRLVRLFFFSFSFADAPFSHMTPSCLPLRLASPSPRVALVASPPFATRHVALSRRLRHASRCRVAFALPCHLRPAAPPSPCRVALSRRPAVSRCRVTLALPRRVTLTLPRRAAFASSRHLPYCVPSPSPRCSGVTPRCATLRTLRATLGSDLGGNGGDRVRVRR